MSYPTAVNDQITDAITQANTKVLGDAPAMAMGMLYQSTAQALANAAHNAVTAQQNAGVILQATTTQAVAGLLSLDGTTAASETPNAVHSSLQHVAAAAQGVNPQIKDALKLAESLVLGASSDVAYGFRSVMDALTTSLENISAAEERKAMDCVRTAATAACLNAMIREPEKAESLQNVLRTIQDL